MRTEGRSSEPADGSARDVASQRRDPGAGGRNCLAGRRAGAELAAAQERSGRLRPAMLTARAGYCSSPPAERAAFWTLSSFTTTIATSRIINYVRERRRPMPRVRSAARLMARAPTSNHVRVHHSLPGIGIGFAAGGTAVFLTCPAQSVGWLSVPFGTGVALTADELRLLAGRNDPYWGGEGFALAQCAAGALGAVCLGTLFQRRGRRVVDSQQRPLGGLDGSRER